MVHEPFGVHAGAGAAGAQGVDGALFEDPGALALFDVRAGPVLQDDAVDAGVVQQPGEEQPGRAGAA